MWQRPLLGCTWPPKWEGSRHSGSTFPFTRLPANVQEHIIQQGCRLGQQYQYATIPRVCRNWRRVALSSCSSLDVRVNTSALADQLQRWLRRHGTSLTHVRLSNSLPLFFLTWNMMDGLLQTLGTTAPQLLSLDLSAASVANTQRLALLTQLTSLRARVVNIKQPFLGLTNLRSLGLCFGETRPPPHVFPDLASSLCQLTRLALAMPAEGVEAGFEALTSIQGLQELELTGQPLQPQQLVHLRGLPCTALSISLPMWVGALVLEQLYDCLSGTSSLHKLTVSYEVGQATGYYVYGEHVYGHHRDQSVSWAPKLVSQLAASAMQLDELHLRYINMQQSVGELALLPHLTSLNLSHCGLLVGAHTLQQLTVLSGLRALGLEDGDPSSPIEEGEEERLAGGSRSSQDPAREMVLRILLAKLPRLEHLTVNGWSAKLKAFEPSYHYS